MASLLEDGISVQAECIRQSRGFQLAEAFGLQERRTRCLGVSSVQTKVKEIVLVLHLS